MDYRERERIERTVRKRRLHTLLTVLFFMFMVPYVISLFAGQYRERAVLSSTDGLLISYDTGKGSLILPLDEYLQGALAVSIPAECEEEALRSQAVILRTLCYYIYENRENVEDRVILAEALGQDYRNSSQRREMWGDSFEEKEEKMKKAVESTDGIVLTMEGKVMEPAYFWLSGGNTRDGSEVLGEERGVGFVSVPCDRDREAEDYLQKTEINLSEFFQILEDYTGADADGGEQKITLLRDSAGYVLKVQYLNEEISGEKFRELFSLPSSCFEIETMGRNVVITTRGVGHGLGYDQYYGNYLAQNGNDYVEILNYFFPDFVIEKME